MSSISRVATVSVFGLVVGLLIWVVRSIVRLPFNVAAALNDGIDDRRNDVIRGR